MSGQQHRSWPTIRSPGRRSFLARVAAAVAAPLLAPITAAAAGTAAVTRPIPVSGEPLPVIGMGTWITFDVGPWKTVRDIRVEIVGRLFDDGGAVIDSSPMYGYAEEVVGHCLQRLDNDERLFSATKVWIVGERLGIAQMRNSANLWGTRPIDLMQIHNMLDWRTHLETLAEWKARGRIRYIGITTSHGRRHEALEQAMSRVPFDFVQFTYNVLDREAEQRLLPLAAERGMAVIVNRPFRRGALLDRVAARPVPAWPAEIGCSRWSQLLLKFIVSHPAVTCAIPATSRLAHMAENMVALRGPLPDAELRERIAAAWRAAA